MFTTLTTASLSEWKHTLWPCHHQPHNAEAITIGTSSKTTILAPNHANQLPQTWKAPQSNNLAHLNNFFICELMVPIMETKSDRSSHTENKPNTECLPSPQLTALCSDVMTFPHLTTKIAHVRNFSLE